MAGIRTVVAGGLLATVVMVGAGCGGQSKSSAAAPTGVLHVVAAENFWGSIASQLGGNRIQVNSVITNPATDPHDYEPTAADARTIAGARMVVVNGIGYDPWADKQLMIDSIVSDYNKLDPEDSGYFAQQKTHFETKGLAQYKQLIATIRRKYSGVPVGASESMFAPLAQALGLKVLTPPTFLKAISEGTESTAGDKTTIDRQIAQKQIKVWVFNSQNSTPDVKRITDAARKRGIPVATITETLVPASASFQDWQSRQLQALAAALAQATGR